MILNPANLSPLFNGMAGYYEHVESVWLLGRGT
jgi:hypothetical protein